ncbi:MAG: hypothetical protein ACD_78C00435G0002 [uncultured bacterium (gcode 4)]|uniref:Uncharacterized protein n=1 Tax=uncultured bacterium (gcode 4) TaxID=1234023 RepID=K1XGG9_9BACT|nr:MAG: hypothetical protein ACD_78C00435G0002 [uncultured bacterium (gcode 4)]
MLSALSNEILQQDENNPNVFIKREPVVIVDKEEVDRFFTYYWHMPAESLVYWGNNTTEYRKILIQTPQEISRICTDVWLWKFKSWTQEKPEQTKWLIEQMRRENPRFLDFSEPIQDGDKKWVNIETSQCFNIVASVEMEVSLILESLNNQKKVIQKYQIWIARGINTSMMYWVDFDKRLYHYKESDKFMVGVMKVWDRNGLYKAYSELFGEEFPKVKAYYD